MNNTNHLLSQATVSETANVADNVSIAIKNALLSDDYLNSEGLSLSNDANAMLEGMGADRKKQLKEEVNNADDRRGNLLSALSHILQGYILWNDPTTAGAAQKLYDVMKAQGKGIASLTYEMESAKIDSLLKKYDEPANVAAITTVGIGALVQSFNDVQSNFKSLYQQSAELEAMKEPTVAPTNIRREVQERLNIIIDYLISMSRANSAVYGTLSATVAELVNTVNGKIRMRYTSDNNDENKTKQE